VLLYREAQVFNSNNEHVIKDSAAELQTNNVLHWWLIGGHRTQTQWPTLSKRR